MFIFRDEYMAEASCLMPTQSEGSPEWMQEAIHKLDISVDMGISDAAH